MKESRKLNNIYKIRVDNIELDINSNPCNSNRNNNLNYENRHNYDSNQFVKKSNNFVYSALNNNSSNNHTSSTYKRCCCCCTCCCCKDNYNKNNASQVILSLINKSTKCPKCNSEFYDLSTSFLNKSNSKIYKYKSSSNNNQSENTSKHNHNYLEKINSTLSKLQSNHNHQSHKSKTSSTLLNHTLPANVLNSKENKTITSKLDYSQYIRSPLIQNIKLYKPKESLLNNYRHNLGEPVQAIHPKPNSHLDNCTKQTSASRFTKVTGPKLLNENKNYGTNFFLNVYNINDSQVEHKFERKTSARSLKKCDSDDLDKTLVSTPRREKQLNESNISTKPPTPPPVKIRTSTHNMSKLNESINQTVNNLNESLMQKDNANNKNQLNNSNAKLFIGNTSSLRGNYTMTNLTNGGDINNLSKRSNLTSNNNNNNTFVTIEDDITQNVIESNIDFTKTMSSNDFSNYIDKIINQFRNKTRLYNNNKNNSERKLKESSNNLSKLKKSEINRPFIPKIESNLSNNNNNNTSMRDSNVSNVTSRHATKATVTPETYASRLNESVNERNSHRPDSSSRRPSQSNDSNYMKYVELNNNRSSVVERRSDLIEGSSFINFTHSYEIEEDDDGMEEDEYDEYLNNDGEDDVTTNEPTLNSSQS